MAEFVPSHLFSRRSAENVERLPGNIFNALGKLGSYLGSAQAATDYSNLLKGQIGRSAKADTIGPDPLAGDPTGRYAPGFMQQPFAAPKAPTLPPPGQGVTPIVRHDDDQYRQLLSQYGALAAAGRKGDVASQEKAEQLGKDIWEKKYAKTSMVKPGGAVGSENPLMQSMREMFPEHYGQAAAFNIPQGFDVSEGFSVAANAVPAPWHTQGQAVSAPYQEAMGKAFEKTNPMNLVSQQQPGLPEDVGEKVRSFLAGKGQFMYGKQ